MQSTHTKVSTKRTCSGGGKEDDLSLEEKVVAIAEVQPRDPVTARVTLESKAGGLFAEAQREKLLAEEAAAAKRAACEEAAAARPSGHLMAALSGIGTRVSASLESAKETVLQLKHERSAASEEELLLNEEEEYRQTARAEAKKDAINRATRGAHSTVVSEYVTGNEVVAVAMVPARDGATGTGIVDTHRTVHVSKATEEREAAVAAEDLKRSADQRGEKAHVGCEAKAGVRGIGTAIGAKFTEARQWLNEMLHERRSSSAQSRAESEMGKDIEKAREKAKQLAEQEANAQDRASTAHVIGEIRTPSAAKA